MAGTSTEGGSTSTAPTSDLALAASAGDRYNVLVALDHYRREELFLSERDFTKDQDFRNREAGTLTRATVSAYQALNGVPNTLGRTPFANCPASDIVDSSLLNPLLTGRSCAVNIAPLTSVFPETKRTGLLARGTWRFRPR